MDASSSSAAAGTTAAFQAKLYRYRRLLFKRWWILFLTISVIVCGQAFYLQNQPRTFTSTSRMWMSGQLNLAEGRIFTDELANFFGTQIELLRSENIISRARARVQVLRPDLISIPISLSAFQSPRTDIFVLQASGSEPAYTQAFLDALMEEYLEYKKEIRVETSGASLMSVTEQLATREKDLKEALDKMHEFQRQNNLVLIQEQNNSAGSTLGLLESRLTELRTQHRLLELLSPEQQLERLAQPRPVAATTTPSGTEVKKDETEPTLPQQAYLKTKEQIQILKIERDNWAESLKPAHPKMRTLQEDIERLENALEVYKQQSLEEVQRTRLRLSAEIKNLETTVKEQQAKAEQANQLMAEMEKIKSNVDRMKVLYDKAYDLSRTLQTGATLSQENVSIMERATSAVPSVKNLPKNLAMGAIAGLLLGLGILFLVDRFDDRVSTLSELTQHFTEPIVGQVPELNTRKTKGVVELLQPEDTRHTFAEAYRNIRSSLLFMDSVETKPRLILITSAIPNEGKSTVSANLALTMANAGHRVLLVDADLRRGTLKDLFQIRADLGLTEILKKQATFSQAVVQTSTPNLSLLPRGKACSTAGELFLSSSMAALLRQIESQFDFVLFDSAPVLATDDAATLAPMTDGALFVFRAAFTSARLARNSLAQLEQRKVNLLGVIFNRIDAAMPEYAYYKYSEYYTADVQN